MLRGFSCAICPACIVRTSLIKALTERSCFCRVHHRSLHPRMEKKMAFETLRWHRPVVFYQASVRFVFEQRNYTDLVHCFYSIVLGVSAVYCNCHQVGILVHKKSKREKPLFTNSGWKVIVKFMVINPNYQLFIRKGFSPFTFFVNQYSYPMTAEIAEIRSTIE
jgi:hypothetical protein